MRCSRLGLLCGALVLACGESAESSPGEMAVTTAAAPVESAPSVPAPPPLPQEQAELLSRWYAGVGGRQNDETFGALTIRAGLLQLGKPYSLQPDDRVDEPLRVELSTFECQTFVESTLSLARCIWLGRPDERCFLEELTAFRYRGGLRQDFSSRLHYFAEWITDNAARGRMQELGQALGAAPTLTPFFHFATHHERYPALRSAEILAQMRAIEARLSKTEHLTLDRKGAARARDKLEAGDLVAIVTSKPGVLISHTGLIAKGKDGKPRLLHASSHHKRVLVTHDDVASYVTRWPDRQGLMVARPVAPPTSLHARR